MLSTKLDIRRDDYDYTLAKSMIDIWRRASDLMLNGDYYPLTPFHRSAGKVGRPAVRLPRKRVVD